MVDIELWRKKHHLLTEILLVLYHSLLAPPSHSPRHRSPPIFTTQAGLYSMPTLSSHAPAHTTPSSKRDGADFEPDDEWKRKLKQDIEQSFKSMIQSARDNQQVQLIEGNLSQEELDHEYKRTLHNIKGLAEEQYQLALMKERNERRWIAGVQMLPGWNDVLHEEQQNIMNSIKQSNHSDNSARAAESPTDERSTNGPPPSSSAPGVPHHEGSEPQSSDLPPTREAQTRDRPWSRTLSSPSSSSTDRRRRDNNTQRSSSRDREDQAPPPSSSSLRRHNADQPRPTLSEIFPDTPITQEPEEQHPPSSRSSSGRPRSNSEKPWDPSLGKSSASIRSVSSADRHHFGRSPPKNANSAPPTQNPDLRRSSTTSQEDPPPLPPATKYQIGRRGSTASIRSTGSGHSGKSIRHPTTETIPERADDVEESPSTSTVKERVRKSTADKPPRDKESKRGSRRDSRPTPVDASIMNRYEHEPAPLPSSLRSAPGPSSSTMQYATSSSSSFVEERFHHPPERDRPLKSSRPYLDSDPPYHSREAPQYAPRDMPPSARPGPAPPPRPSPYVEERDFVGPFPPLGRTPASPFTGERESLRDGGRDRDRDSLRERDYHPSISHKSSFSSYDERWRRERDWEQWDEDREARERDNRDREYWERDQRERERGGRDWDHPRERDRGERERDRDRELYERQHREREYAHPHSTPYSARTGGYPTPPSSASRLAQPHVGSVADYLPMQEIYDDGTVPPSSAAAAARGSYGSYRGVVPSPTAMQDDWDYPPRPESGRPSIPTRQPSYGRREGERRGTIDAGGPPELGSCHSSLSYSPLLSKQKKAPNNFIDNVFFLFFSSYRWLYTLIHAYISTLTCRKHTHPTSSTLQRGHHRRRTTTRMAGLARRERTAPPSIVRQRHLGLKRAISNQPIRPRRVVLWCEWWGITPLTTRHTLATSQFGSPRRGGPSEKNRTTGVGEDVPFSATRSSQSSY